MTFADEFLGTVFISMECSNNPSEEETEEFVFFYIYVNSFD